MSPRSTSVSTSGLTRCRRLLVIVGVLVLSVGSLAACGDDGKDDKVQDATTTTAPEDLKAPMAEVLAKLPKTVAGGRTAAAAAAKGEFATAMEEYDELFDVWVQIEGTIKDTDLDAYEKIETAQGLIHDGAENDNAERVEQGADDQAAAVKAFITAQGS